MNANTYMMTRCLLTKLLADSDSHLANAKRKQKQTSHVYRKFTADTLRRCNRTGASVATDISLFGQLKRFVQRLRLHSMRRPDGKIKQCHILLVVLTKAIEILEF